MPIPRKAIIQFVERDINWERVSRKAASSNLGDRLWPSRTSENDKKSNLRADKGPEIDGKVKVVIQANKNAEDPSVKAFAAKDSHRTVAEFTIDPKNPDIAKAKEDAVASFDERS